MFRNEGTANTKSPRQKSWNPKEDPEWPSVMRRNLKQKTIAEKVIESGRESLVIRSGNLNYLLM